MTDPLKKIGNPFEKMAQLIKDMPINEDQPKKEGKPYKSRFATDGLDDKRHEGIQKIIDKPDFERSYFMFGKNGTGKTYDCLRLCEIFDKLGKSVRLLDWFDDIEYPAKYFDRKQLDSVLEDISRASVITIDDIDKCDLFLNHYLKKMLDIVKDKIVIITTNISNEDFREHFGGRITDRIFSQKFIRLDYSDRESMR